MRLFTLLILSASLTTSCLAQEPRKSDGFIFETATASYQVEGAWDEDGKSESIWDRLTHTFGILSASIATTCLAQEPRKFPDGFIFGAATASYQVEGAWDEDGKSESIWDRLSHTYPCAVDNCDTGDVAGDSYHNVERDVEMMRELGLDSYRFSISWPRILPTSFPDFVNHAGAAYYNKLIDEMLKYNIEPMVTLFHWDLPQKLQDMGGWTNPHIVDWYGDYARVVFGLFGDRVKNWITMNEPRDVCLQGYSLQALAPMLVLSGYGEYLCTNNLILAHARAYRIYEEEFKAEQGGRVGITFSYQWWQEETEDQRQAGEDFMKFELNWFAHPIFSEEGDHHPFIKETVAAKSAAQGFQRSRLPSFTPEEVDYIRGTADFFGVNHYTTYYVYRNESVVNPVPSYYDDVGVAMYQDPNWVTSSKSVWLAQVPWGFYKLLKMIREEFNNPLIYITENGYSTDKGLEDHDRVLWYRTYLDAMLDAIDEGSNIQGYYAWSLMDNFEWLQGYSSRFGLYEVDYEDPARTRTPRRSAFVYKEIVRSRTLDPNYEPDTTVMTIDEGH